MKVTPGNLKSEVIAHFKRQVIDLEELTKASRFRSAVQAVLSAEFYATMAAYRQLESVKLTDERINANFEKRLSQALAGSLKQGSLPKQQTQRHSQSNKDPVTDGTSSITPSVEMSLLAMKKRRDIDAKKSESIRKKLIDISEVMTRFLSAVQEQDTMIGDILVRADESTRTIEKSNQLLASADDHAKTFGGLWALFFFTLALLLLFYDFVK